MCDTLTFKRQHQITRRLSLTLIDPRNCPVQVRRLVQQQLVETLNDIQSYKLLDLTI